METSQQQRRPTVGQFAQTLADADLDFDAIDLADILWLAQFTGSAMSSRPASPPPPPPPPSSPPPASNQEAADESAFNVYPEESSSQPASQQSADTPVEKPKGTPFSVPAAPAIRTRLDLARSLRPLMRKVPSRRRFELDETATVTQIAETEVWLPVVRPTSERWLELDLVVESSKTTVIWERAIAELNHLVEYQGAFRAVRTWRLSAIADRIQLFPRWREGGAKGKAPADGQNNARPHTPSELIDPTGRRLIWLVTDCTSSLWQSELIYATLQKWANVQPTAIIQLFPNALWKRTALNNGYQVSLSALAPGLPTARLEVDGIPTRLERRGLADRVTVPIVSLDADAMRGWARVIAGSGDSRTPGRTFDLTLIQRHAVAKNAGHIAASTSLPTAQQRVDFFRATTKSKTVKHLANLMAATPVSLPVIDLLREAFRADFQEEVRQSHVAEVLLSGLLRRCDTPDEAVCRYEFIGDAASDPHERVRDILLGDTSITKTLEVLDVLSASICRKIDSPIKSFQALLRELKATDQEALRAAALPFARVGISVLRRLGGVHAEIARQYDSGNQDDGIPEPNDWLTDFSHQPLTYNVAEYLDFPPLTDFDFTQAELIEEDDTFPPPLKPDDFKVVTVELQSDSTLARVSETDAYRLLEQKESEIKRRIRREFEEQEIDFLIDMHPRDVDVEGIDASEIELSSEQEIGVEIIDTQILEIRESHIVFRATTTISFAVNVGYFDNESYRSPEQEVSHWYRTWPSQTVNGSVSINLQILEDDFEEGVIDVEIDSVALQPDTPVRVRETTELDRSASDTDDDLSFRSQSIEVRIATLEQRATEWHVVYRFREVQRYVEPLSDSVELELIAIPGATFLMGSPENELKRNDDESPQHEVIIHPFFMGRYLITQNQWRIVAHMPQINRELNPDPSNFKGDNRPVEKVSWNDAVEFCDRLSAHTERQYRLPSEAEWEYACRAGTTSPFHFGETISSDLANYQGHIAYANGPAGEYRRETTPIDSFEVANAFGLSDMHGNLREWCQDAWHQNYVSAPIDGSAWLSDNSQANRVVRGGAWSFEPQKCRSACRDSHRGVLRSNIGFRVVCSAPKPLP